MNHIAPYPDSEVGALIPARYQIFKYDYELNEGPISSSAPAYEK